MKSTRIVVLLAIVTGLVFATAGSAFAERPPDKPTPPGQGGASSAKRCGWFGEVVERILDEGDLESFTLMTKKGINVTVLVDDEDEDNTRCHKPGELDESGNPWNYEICSDIEEGDWVAVKGKLKDGDFVAQKIQLMPESAIAGLTQKLHFHCLGEIIDIEGVLPGNRITVECKKQGELTFSTGEETELRPNGAEWVDVEVEAKVTVVAKRGDEPFEATAIVIHGIAE